MMKLIQISEGHSLYRYDLQQPPEEWKGEFHSCEYQYACNDEIIYKNQASLYFFFENKDITIRTAHKAIDTHSKDGFWLTTATVTGTIRLLDLRGGSTLAMLNTLLCTYPNIFNTRLTTSGKPDSSELSTLQPLFEYVMRHAQNNEEYYSKWLELHKPFIAPGYPYSLLGQILCDFNNGPKFKTVLEELGVDGFIFDECYGGSTVCLLSPDKLVPPKNIYFDRKELLDWLKRIYLE